MDNFTSNMLWIVVPFLTFTLAYTILLGLMARPLSRLRQRLIDSQH